MQADHIQKLEEKFGERLERDVHFSDLTTVSIGGPVPLLFRAQTKEELYDALTFVTQNHIPYFILGGGSNLLVSDEGVDKFIIKVATTGITKEGSRVTVQAGTVLQELVNFTITNGLAGVHKMTGIPGTVGGAVYGNAGAYGQTISDYLDSVLCFDGEEYIKLNKEVCEFSYRDSGFKNSEYVILEITFSFPEGDSQALQKEADECLQLRLKKYLPGIKCPGSFFKNLFTANVPPQALAMLPPREDTYGKLPAYIFIEELGLKGKQVGKIKIADYHGNLFMNLGGGTAHEFWVLAKECFDKTKEKYGVELEPEVQLINLPSLNAL